ncbi:MAG TPA: tetratricopeptide repeat protein, partial [Isosphaeraceae bacterium]
ARTRAEEERKRRRLTVALAASAFLIASLIGGVAAWQAARFTRAERRVGIGLAAAEARLRNAHSAGVDDAVAWEDARVAADGLLSELDSAPVGSATAARVRRLHDEVVHEVNAARRDRALLADLVAARSVRAELPEGGLAGAVVVLVNAFARYRSDSGVGTDDTALIRLLSARPAPVRHAAAAGLDEWAIVAHDTEPGSEAWRRPLRLAEVLDPDPDRQLVRHAWAAGDLASLRRLAEPGRADRMDPATINLLADALDAVSLGSDSAAVVSLLKRGQLQHPRDVWLNVHLGSHLAEQGPEGSMEAIRYYSMAYTLQPETGHRLAHLLADRGRGEEAEAIFAELAEHDDEPETRARNLTCYGTFLKERGRPAATAVLGRAEAACREAIRLRLDDPGAQNSLGMTLAGLGRPVESEAAYREAIRLRPDDPNARINLGLTLTELGRLEEAEAAYREAIRLLPDSAEAYSNLGATLAQLGRLTEAEAAYREAIRLRPDDPNAHYNLA